VREVDGLEAVVEVEGQSERVGIDLVPDARPGDLLLCHAGIALERLEGDRG
jgi:hydrogenase maturation factor